VGVSFDLHLGFVNLLMGDHQRRKSNGLSPCSYCGTDYSELKTVGF